MVDPQEESGKDNAQNSRMSFDPGNQAAAQPVHPGGDMDEGLNPAQTQRQESRPEAEKNRCAAAPADAYVLESKINGMKQSCRGSHCTFGERCQAH